MYSIQDETTLIRGIMDSQETCLSTALPAMTAIGVIHTPFLHAKGTPIQSAVAGNAQGVVEVFAEFAEGLKDLTGFERLWLIYWMDRASAAQLITRPYLDNEDRGVFATRSPAHPNHIGLSSVRGGTEGFGGFRAALAVLREGGAQSRSK